MGIFSIHKEFLIEASDNSASGVKVWILTAMVVLLMAIVSFLTVRLINTVDETEAAVQASKEVQASQGEVIKGLQRDRDNTDKEIERLRNQVDRLKDDNAALKAKVGIPLTLNSEPPSGGFFVSKGCAFAWPFSFVPPERHSLCALSLIHLAAIHTGPLSDGLTTQSG
ncbi:TPA: hypothetical protein OMJ77_000049 [Klebsiella pneumoniae]|nr:hypothetical protein [Klebsiella pneumoniae]